MDLLVLVGDARRSNFFFTLKGSRYMPQDHWAPRNFTRVMNFCRVNRLTSGLQIRVLLTRSNYNITNVMKQYDVLQIIKMITVPLDYIMTERET